jgi:hypothetical protein
VEEACKDECILGSLWYPWIRAGYPLLTAFGLQKNLESYINKYLKLKKSQHKDSAGCKKTRDNFKKIMKGMRRHKNRIVHFSGFCEYCP